MRLKRLLAVCLSIALAAPPGAFAQSSTPATPKAPSLEIGPIRSYTSPLIPDNIAPGVFGTYGGAGSRFAGTPGANVSLHAPLLTQQLPDLGDGSGGSLTPQAERKLGERVMREVRADPDYLDDWLVRDYLNSVSAKLSAAATALYIGGYQPDFDLFPMRDAQINAFSLPGGFIGVNTGLIVTTQTESELASVIGHEMGHVLQRHIARMISAGERTGYAALAAMLLGVLAGVVAHSGDLGGAIVMGGQAYAVDSQLKFSRAAEHEADRVGFQMLAGAGYDPYAMPTFFGRLDRASMGDAGIPVYARTHPLTVERIADMEDRARRSPYRQPRQSPEYGFVRARARVLQDRSRSDYADEISRMRIEIEDKTALNVAANWYGIAFAQMLLERYDDAAASLAMSRKVFDATGRSEGVAARSSPSLDVLDVDIARRAGRNDDAVRLAEVAQRRWPQSHAAIDMRLQTLLSARRFAEAQALAFKETRSDPQQPLWWRYLAQASVGTGDALTQHRALAEKFALEGAWPSAIRQLKEARDIKTAGYYELSTIDARLHDFEARYKEEREDDKNRG
ncbi:M48 family metalloprotease [Paraburkholderia sartisoli]|uniref:Putative Zn-dependent protease, contains TPR repeats n=1 Tax=Paraburkholderia sartisoli TaxID=83784 RepID=A0A1H3YM56_9BURK|nr:M48 family metalloprotease [Paraburkholderia sartisoli]SEA12497.1 Putative Zn-dependent protease, contains TPR repeats [Paraburkholderia sartisoli]